MVSPPECPNNNYNMWARQKFKYHACFPEGIRNRIVVQGARGIESMEIVMKLCVALHFGTTAQRGVWMDQLSSVRVLWSSLLMARGLAEGGRS